MSGRGSPRNDHQRRRPVHRLSRTIGRIGQARQLTPVRDAAVRAALLGAPA